MPVYAFKCPECQYRVEHLLSHEERHTPFICDVCGAGMIRDFAAENVTNNFRPTTDLYARKKVGDAKKGRGEQYHPSHHPPK